jgi:hypothetical protein
MSEARVCAERVMEAPPDVVYRCIADYQRHHRPEGFLPPVFTSMQVERGGVGAGTVIRFTSRIGRMSRAMRQEVSEPEPGRVLVEAGGGTSTTFTVQPDGPGSRVRIESVLDARGVSGFFTRWFAPGLLRPVYIDELQRLEQYARALAQQGSASDAHDYTV